MATSITLRQLEYFVAAARAGTMAGAAGALHVSPAAVSLGIAELERTLGGELFRRVAHQPLVLTSTGQDLLAGATTIVSDARDLEQRVDERSTVAGVLHVGCFATLAPFVVPRLVSAVASTHPHLRVEVTEDDAAGVQRAVLDGRTELAVLYGIDLRPGLEATTVTTMRPYVVLPADHRLATRRRVRLGELAADPIILLESPPSQLHTRAVLQAAGVTPRVERVTRSFETLRALVARGHGWGVLVQRPASATSYEGLALATVEIADPVAPAPVVAAAVAGARHSRRAAVVLDTLRGVLAGDHRRRSAAT